MPKSMSDKRNAIWFTPNQGKNWYCKFMTVKQMQKILKWCKQIDRDAKIVLTKMKKQGKIKGVSDAKAKI